MNRLQSQVQEFHAAMGQTIGDTPAIRDAELRARLILEEAFETVEALLGSEEAQYAIERAYDAWCDLEPRYMKPSLEGVIDGMADLAYVTYGTAVACGIDLEPFSDEVHESNMTKPGGVTRADGKIGKGPNYRAPRIAEMLAKLMGEK